MVSELVPGIFKVSKKLKKGFLATAASPAE